MTNARSTHDGETVQIAYPSVLAPGLPAFTMDAPLGWHVGEFPGALIAAAAPEVEGQFRPNLVVTGRRVPDSMPLTEAADDAIAELRGIYGDVVTSDRQVTNDEGAELLQQALGYHLPNGTELAHLNVLLLVHDEIAPGAFRSLLGFNAVCTREQAEQLGPKFQSLIASVHIERRVLDVGGTGD